MKVIGRKKSITNGYYPPKLALGDKFNLQVSGHSISEAWVHYPLLSGIIQLTHITVLCL